ncbi:MAG: AMP-binding protein [Bacteroidota bacterium]
MFEKIINLTSICPENNAFYINSVFYTYLETAKRINGIKMLLQNSTSQNIGIIINDDIETYASIFAVLFSGKTYVPINPINPIDRNDKIIEQAEITAILISNKKHLSGIFSDIATLKILETFNVWEENDILSLPKIDYEQNAYILFTSGSTGVPKGVPISYKNLISFVNAFFSLGYRINEKDRFLQIFDLTFDLSIMSFLIPLCCGACVYTVPLGEIKFTAAYSIIEDHEITVALMVPSMLSFLRKYFDEIRLEKMKYSFFCGEALYEDLTEAWADCVPNALIQNVYGPTEATIFCLTYNWNRNLANKNLNGIVCIGKPMKDMIAVIVDNQLKPVTDGILGELCLSGPQLTTGYLKNIQKNKESFFEINSDGKVQIFYRTGDICFKDNDGDFLFSGRLDNQVKIQGFRVELSEIEFHAREYMNGMNAVVHTSINSSGNTLINLFVENFNNVDDLLVYLKSKLPPYMIPNAIKTIPSFPLNINGKVDRKSLKELI